MTPRPKQKRHGKQMQRLALLGERLYGYRRRVATIGVAVLAILLGFHVVFGRDGLTVYHNKQHDLRDLKAEMSSLQRENAQLQGHVDRLTTDPNAIEHQAREDLHYARPGEVIVTLPGNDGKR